MALASSPGGHSRGGDAERAGQHGGGLGLLPTTGAAAGAPDLPAEVHCEEPIDEGVQTGIEEAKEEEDVAEGGRDLLPGQHVWGEPVPDAQEVVGSPAYDEGEDNDDGHLQGAQPGPRDIVVGAAEVDLLGGDCRRMRGGKNGQRGGSRLI